MESAHHAAAITIAVLWWRGRGRAGGLPPRPLAATLVLLVVAMAVDGVNSTLAGRQYPPPTLCFDCGV